MRSKKGVHAMQDIVTIGLDVAKSVFHVHGVDASAHHWARELPALGHEMHLVPPQYVKLFVKTNKNDAADAEAICEALMRPTMRFAAVKSAEQRRC